MDYAINRYYSQSQGRFTSPDPLLASGRAEIPQSWNRYAYVLNNPLILIDPDGLDWYHNKETNKVRWSKERPGDGWVLWDKFSYYGGEGVGYVALDPLSSRWQAGFESESAATQQVEGWYEGGLSPFAQGVVSELGARNENFGYNFISVYGQSVVAGLTLGTSSVPLLLGAAMETAFILQANGVDPINPTVAASTDVTLYKDKTEGNSIPNRATNIRKDAFIQNLQDSGYTYQSTSKDGRAVIYGNGNNTYRISDRPGTRRPTAEFFIKGERVLKIRLRR